MTSSDFSKQTLVFLSVLVLLVMALFPVVVIRLAIVTDVFTLHPSHTNGDFEANGNALHNSHSKALGWNETQSILSSGPPASSTATPEAPSTTSAPPSSSTATPEAPSTTSAPPSSSTASSVAQTALSSGPPASSTASPVSSVASEAKIRAHTGILMKKLIKASLQ